MLLCAEIVYYFVIYFQLTNIDRFLKLYAVAVRNTINFNSQMSVKKITQIHIITSETTKNSSLHCKSKMKQSSKEIVRVSKKLHGSQVMEIQ